MREAAECRTRPVVFLHCRSVRASLRTQALNHLEPCGRPRGIMMTPLCLNNFGCRKYAAVRQGQRQAGTGTRLSTAR
jgi:hypothetical protein